MGHDLIKINSRQKNIEWIKYANIKSITYIVAKNLKNTDQKRKQNGSQCTQEIIGNSNKK